MHNASMDLVISGVVKCWTTSICVCLSVCPSVHGSSRLSAVRATGLPDASLFQGCYYTLMIRPMLTTPVYRFECWPSWEGVFVCLRKPIVPSRYGSRAVSSRNLCRNLCRITFILSSLLSSSLQELSSHFRIVSGDTQRSASRLSIYFYFTSTCKLRVPFLLLLPQAC